MKIMSAIGDFLVSRAALREKYNIYSQKTGTADSLAILCDLNALIFGSENPVRTNSRLAQKLNQIASSGGLVILTSLSDYPLHTQTVEQLTNLGEFLYAPGKTLRESPKNMGFAKLGRIEELIENQPTPLFTLAISTEYRARYFAEHSFHPNQDGLFELLDEHIDSLSQGGRNVVRETASAPTPEEIARNFI